MKVQYLFQNNKGRDFVCGDLHGCFALLDKKLEALNFDTQKDRLFSVGDIIDRGEDSPKALQYLQQDWFYCIRGNHEQMLIDWCQETTSLPRFEAFLFHMQNGGIWIADYLGIHIQELADDVFNDVSIMTKYPLLRQWLKTLENLPYAIEIKSSDKKIGLIHAEIPDNIPWPSLEAELDKDKVRHSCLYSRKRIRALLPGRYRIKGVDEVYCGHTIVSSPKTIGNVHYIDTGAFANQNLTIIQL